MARDAFFSRPPPPKRKRESGEFKSAGGKKSLVKRKGSSSGGKGKENGSAVRPNGTAKPKSRRKDDEDIGDEDEYSSADELPGQEEEYSSEDDANETPAQKRLRLASMYLESLKKDTRDEDIGFDAADLDRDLIADRLQKDVLEHSGKMHLQVGSSLQVPVPSSSVYKTPRANSHRGPMTSALASQDGAWLYTSSKDGSLIKWSLDELASEGRIKLAQYVHKKSKVLREGASSKKGKAKEVDRSADPGGHSDEILDLALTEDGTVLATAGKDKVVGVWAAEGADLAWKRGLGGHKDRIAAISFRTGTTQLFSTSFDRTVKVFDAGTLSYVETLFGHQDCIQAVSALRGDNAITAGGRDKTLRYWKIAEESQLVFRGGVTSKTRKVLESGKGVDDLNDDPEEGEPRKGLETRYVEGSIDVVAMVDDTTFLSGGDSGALCLWNTTKKKPVFTAQLAHGISEHVSETEGVIGNPRWITALACLEYGDVFASGSWDGSIRLWKLDERLRSFTALTTIPAVGVVNSLQVYIPRPVPGGEPGIGNGKDVVVVAAVAKELRLGRWLRVQEGKEGAVVAVVQTA